MVLDKVDPLGEAWKGVQVQSTMTIMIFGTISKYLAILRIDFKSFLIILKVLGIFMYHTSIILKKFVLTCVILYQSGTIWGGVPEKPSNLPNLIKSIIILECSLYTITGLFILS